MKIIVYNDKNKININLFTWLGLNSFTYPLIALYLRKKGIKIKTRNLKKIIKICKIYKKKHPDWKIVETESTTNEKVILEI